MKLYSSTKHGKNFVGIKEFNKDIYLHRYDVWDDDNVTEWFSRGIPKAIVSDHVFEYHHPDYGQLEIIGFPGFIQSELNKLSARNLLVRKDKVVNNCFNFTSNKKQINRFLLIKLVEYFKLDSFDYTWSAVDQSFDMSEIINELNSLNVAWSNNLDFKSCILSNITLPKKFISVVDNQTESDPNDGVGIKSFAGIFGPTDVWNNGLDEIISTSAVSLISESIGFQRACAFTEKTLFPVMGLTFPIWVGGVKQAEHWKTLGFDIFEDVIDHSYQYHETLIERCYYAFANNLRILQDLEYAKEMINKCMPRLIANYDLLRNGHIAKNIKNTVEHLPKNEIDLLEYFVKTS
jgi:hypothetical protein